MLKKSLPDELNWFDLDKYEGAKKFKAKDWYIHLSIRIHCNHLIDTWLRDMGDEETTRSPQPPDLISIIRDNPIIDFENDEIMQARFMNLPIHELINKEPFYTSGVYPITIQELKMLVSEPLSPEFSSKTKIKVNDLLEESGRSKINSDTPIHQLIATRTSEDLETVHKRQRRKFTMPFACVNLELPDSYLVKQFKVTLNKLRRDLEMEHKEKAEHSYKNYQNWVDYGILPYIDLKLWEKETGHELSYSTISELIYPSHSKRDANNSRRTTDELASKFIGKELFDHHPEELSLLLEIAHQEESQT